MELEDTPNLLQPYNSEQIVQLRPHWERPQAGQQPLGTQWEQEAYYDAAGELNAASVMTVFLRGSECSFRCLMCDLWKFTHVEKTAPGAVPNQIACVLENENLAEKREPWIKLYNASNFFAPKNVPRQDLPIIARQLERFGRVIVENHPCLCRESLDFAKQLKGKLEVAMGLETTHPEVLPRLNKQMTTDDFQRACHTLRHADVDIRAFVLLCPPWLDEQEGVEWCSRSINFARDCGVRHVSVIPTRSGNGAIEQLRQRGHFHPPTAAALEQVLQEHVGQQDFVVTADVWDWQQLQGTCERCRESRLDRMRTINLTQQSIAEVEPHCGCLQEK